MTQSSRPSGPRPPVRPLGYSGPAPRTRSSIVQQEEQRQALWDWLTPVIMLGTSALVIMFMPLVYEGFDFELLAEMGIAVLVLAVIKTVIALVLALGIAVLFGSGFDAFWRGVLKLAAIVMAATAVMSLVSFLGCFAIFVYAGVLVSLMMGMMDLDRGEAIGFAVVFIVAEVVTYFFIMTAIMAMTGA